MSEHEVVTLNVARDIDEAAIGQKAMGLVRLSRAGLKVPDAFCVTETVFREHLERNHLTTNLRSALERLSQAKNEAKLTILADLQKAIIEPPLAQGVRDRIENEYRALRADRVAVRSSGTAEDLPGHSFAGQYDTYLGIANLEDCVDAIKKCWASLWTPRAYEYRERNGFDHLKISMAVIVQSLIDTGSSGVIFTVDPVTGNRNRIVVEACFGLGQTLVSGKVTPDRFVVYKKNLKPLSRTVSQKKIACTLDLNGTVEEKAVSDEQALVCSLTKKQIKKLAKAARRIETEFGRPQDIEWAISKDRIFFLQSRPITALPPEKSWEDRQIWCCNPAKEVMPDVVNVGAGTKIIKTGQTIQVDGNRGVVKILKRL